MGSHHLLGIDGLGGPSLDTVPSQGSENLSDLVLPHDLGDTPGSCRLWELEQDTNVQITKVKRKYILLAGLQAPTPDWIQSGYKLPLFSEPPKNVRPYIHEDMP